MASQTIGTTTSAPLPGELPTFRLSRAAAKRALRWRKAFRSGLAMVQNLVLATAFTAAAALGLALVLALGGVLAF